VELLQHDGIGVAERVEPGFYDLAEAADGKAGAREWMSPDDPLRQAELQPELPHLVLEQVAKRLDEFELQVVGQAADVVVELDGGGGAVGRRAAL
jgi:hypothetical protein